jgi:spore maturation protein A
MCGVMCLWTGVMELMDQCALTDKIAALFRPLLRCLLPHASRDSETLAAVSANLSADLLGLGNAATPLGIRAARRMAQGCGGTASHELCLLVVLNSASIQLLPTTVAGVRSALGSADPFDILPAVWTASLLSVLAGLAAAKLLARIWRG